MRHNGIKVNLVRRWLSAQVIVTLLAIVAASVQCATRCATTPCHSAQAAQVPPCHSHSQSKQSAPTERCQYVSLSDGKASPVFNLQHLSHDIDTERLPDLAPDAFQQPARSVVFRAAPPGSPQLLLSSILRI
jgi:hypothetical protein